MDEAEIYLKEIVSLSVENSIKQINKYLMNDRVVPNLKLIITGGQAIETYFPFSPSLRTHDYDLKLVASKYTNINSAVLDRMLLLGRGIVRYLTQELNKYIIKILPKIKLEIKTKYNIELVDQNGIVFKSSSKLRNNFLNMVTFKLRDKVKVRTNAIADVYVVNPKEISEHYLTFTGLEGSNPILSEDAGNYYIPIKYINDLPYAGLGYILWDTLRMIENSKRLGLGKYQRYIQKRDAIIQGLNSPDQKLSCNAMKDYIKTCSLTYSECEIKGRRFKTVDSILRYAIQEGIIPPEYYSTIRNNYDINYICTSVKKMLE